MARASRSFPSKQLNYLPSGGLMGPMFSQEDPESPALGKSLKRQHMASVVGKRAAGTSQITGGDQMAHAMGHYGKKGFPGLGGDGSDEGLY